MVLIHWTFRISGMLCLLNLFSMRQLTCGKSPLCWQLGSSCQWSRLQCTLGSTTVLLGFLPSGYLIAPSLLFHWDCPCHTTWSSRLQQAITRETRDWWETAERRWNALCINSLTSRICARTSTAERGVAAEANLIVVTHLFGLVCVSADQSHSWVVSEKWNTRATLKMSSQKD